MALFGVRIVFVALCVLASAYIVRHRARVVAVLSEFFGQPSIPENLGLMRIAVFWFVLHAALSTQAPWYAQIPRGLRELPWGWHWLDGPLDRLMPHTQRLVQLLIAASFLSLIGLATRWVTVVAALLAVLVLAIPQFYFKINHGMHVQVLCAVVLAASPSGDALSVDAWIRKLRGRPARARSIEYAIPLRACWLLVGTMYLFPGIWKVWSAGDLWLSGIAPKVYLLEALTEDTGFVPLARLDRHPVATVTMGVATLVFELGFFFALFNRTTRIVAAFTASAFHMGTALFLNIEFNPWWPFVVLVDLPEIAGHYPFRVLVTRVPALRDWLTRHGDAHAEQPMQPAVSPWADRMRSSLVGGALVFAQFVAGFNDVNSFPVSVYPKFNHRYTEPPPGTALEFALRSKTGAERPLGASLGPMEGLRRAVLFRIHRSQWRHDKRKLRLLNQLLARIVRETNPEATAEGGTLLVYEYSFPADPADRSRKDENERTLVEEIEL